MKTILILCGLTAVAGGLVIWNALRWPSEYGKFTGAPQTEIALLVEKPKEFLGKTVAVAGTIKQQCQTMGCFFYLDAGKKTLRVDLVDIAMNAPRKEGHFARMEGRMVPYGDGYQLFANAIRFE